MKIATERRVMKIATERRVMILHAATILRGLRACTVIKRGLSGTANQLEWAARHGTEDHIESEVTSLVTLRDALSQQDEPESTLLAKALDAVIILLTP